MQTYTHLALTAVIVRYTQNRMEAGKTNDQLPPIHPRAALFGSILPDLPLILLAGGFIVWDMVDDSDVDVGATTSHVGELFGELFFHSWWVKLLQNLFHAPFLTVMYVLIGYWAWKRGKLWGAALFSLGMATLLHTAFDIPLHYDDGPLLFFPFEWTIRFHSPLSYWDPARFGKEFAIFEHGSFLVMIFWLLRERKKRRRAS